MGDYAATQHGGSHRNAGFTVQARYTLWFRFCRTVVSLRMNADVAALEPPPDPAPCADTLRRINESLQARERLLTASAR